MKNHAALALQYAQDVAKGVVAACKWVKLACKRHVDDLKSVKKKAYPFTFDEDAGNKVCHFLECLPHVSGEWAGATIQLQPWQSFIVCVGFGWVKKKDRKRRFREIYIEVPRKNGKSFLAAGLALYMLTADGEIGAQVFCAATTRTQAMEVFNPARHMVGISEEMQTALGVQAFKTSISVVATNSYFQPIIGKPKDGKGPTFAVIDEYHEHKTSDLFESLRQGMGARKQPIMFTITTAGTDIAGPCYEKRLFVQNVLQGTFDAPTTFGIIYTIDEGDDWTCLDNWRKANPNYGISVYDEFLETQLEEARHRIGFQNQVKCKHLNVWANARSAWMDLDKWKASKRTGLTLTDYEGRLCYIGFDLGEKHDFASKIYLFPEENGDVTTFDVHYLPEATVKDPAKHHYRTWETLGTLTVTDGEVNDMTLIQTEMEADLQRFNVAAMGFDSWHTGHLMQNLEVAGATVFSFGQSAKNLSEPMKEIDAMVRQRRLHHAGSTILDWMMSNVVAREDTNSNIKPVKETPAQKIDGVVALIMAMGLYLNNQMKSKTSVYEGDMWV